MLIDKNILKLYCYLTLITVSLVAPKMAKADERLAVFSEQLDKLHNKYLPLNHPDNPYIRNVSRPKIERVAERFKDLLKGN